MPRKNPIWLVLLLGAVLGWSGCLFRSHKVPTLTTASNVRTATLQELVATLDNFDNAVKTLNATVDIDTSVGGAKKGKVTEYQEIRGYILMRKPEQLRMIGLFPVVRNRAFDMVSDAKGFKLSIPAKNKFIVGPPDVTTPSTNTLENLRPNVIYDALLLPGIDPKTDVAVLENQLETFTDAKTKNQMAFPTYVVDVIKRGPAGWYLYRKVVFSRVDLLPHHQMIYDKTGTMVTEATYDNVEEFNGIKFPTLIHIVRPLEEYTIDLHMVKLTLNEPLKDDQFALAQPAGSQLVNLNGQSAQKETPGGDGEKK